MLMDAEPDSNNEPGTVDMCVKESEIGVYAIRRTGSDHLDFDNSLAALINGVKVRSGSEHLKNGCFSSV